MQIQDDALNLTIWYFDVIRIRSIQWQTNKFSVFVFTVHLNLGWKLLIQHKNSWNLPVTSSFIFRRSVTNFFDNPFHTFFWSQEDEFYTPFLFSFMVIKGLLVYCVQSVAFDLSYDKTGFLLDKYTWKHISV